MPITQRRITDLTSFRETTASPRDVAAIYFVKQIDPYLESALAVSQDLFDRPQLYTNVVRREDSGEAAAPARKRANPPRRGSSAADPTWSESDIVEVLAALRSRNGTDEFVPSREQRRQTYSAIFGVPGVSNDFDKLRDDLIAASTAYSERVFDTGVEMLRERVRTSQRPLKDYLTGLTGASTDWSAHRALAVITEDITFRVLRARGVAAVYGIISEPSTLWPYAADSNGDKLLEEIAKSRPGTDPISRQEASNRQRLATRGAEALASVLDYTENSKDPADDVASLDVLITQCYTWGAARAALAA